MITLAPVQIWKRTTFALLLGFTSSICFSQAIDLQGQAKFKIEAVSGVRSTNANFIPPPDDAPFWHLLGDQDEPVDASLIFSEGGSCAFDILGRVTDPEGRELTLTEPVGDWPTGCTPDYVAGSVSGTATTASTGSVTVRACDPQPVINCADQAFDWEVVAGGDVIAPTTPGTPTLLSRQELSISFAWTASTDASGIQRYDVYRCGPATCTPSVLIGSTTQLTFVDSGFGGASSTPMYAVKAVDNASNVSALSGALAAGTYSAPGADVTACSSGCDFTLAQISSAWAAASPGDVIEIRANSVGGTTTTTTAISCTNKDGTAGNEITLRVRAGDNIIVDAAVNSLDVTGCDYWILDGVDSDRSGVTFGDITDWNASTHTYNQDRGINIDSSSHHFELRNGTVHGGSGFTGNLIDRTTSVCRLFNMRFDLHGTNDASSGTDYGDLVRVQANGCLIEDSEFTHGGHNTIVVGGRWIVLRDSIADGDWSDKSTGSPGNRSSAFEMGNQSSWMPNDVATTTFGPALAEGMIFRNNNNPVDQLNAPGLNVKGFGLIVRDSIVACDVGGVFHGAGYTGIGTASGEVMSRGHFYNLTASGCDGVWGNTDSAFANSMGAANQQLFAFKNNIFASIREGRNAAGQNNQTPHKYAVNWSAAKAGATAMLNGHPNSWKGTVWEYNNFSGPSTAMSFSLTGVGAAVVAITNSSQWPNNVKNNTNATPSFVNESADTRAGYTLQGGSPAGINDGTHLTTTTDAGTTDTTLTFADPRYFYAGADPATWNLGYFGEVGDDICVGATSGTTATNAQQTRILTINYTTGAITVSPGVTHVSGSKVWKRVQDSATCADVWNGRGIHTD